MESTLTNQRSSGRVLPKLPQVRLYGLRASPVPAVVLDESFGGLGIAAPIDFLEPASEIDVELAFDSGVVRSLAVVRHAAALPSGCRLGIEWKAQALSRKLRDLIDVPPHGALQPHPLARILPGGLSMMWKLFEAGRWQHLIDSGERLKKETAAAQVITLLGPIEQFQQAVALHTDSAGEVDVPEIRRALELLIERCICAAG